METETTTRPQAPAGRFDAWCGTCGRVTESDDTTAKWCLDCGDRRES